MRGVDMEITAAHKRIIGYCVGGLLLLLLVLFGVQQCGNWRTDRGLAKDKAKIANTVAEISNVDAQIGELQEKKAELQGELNRDVEDMQNKVFGLDETKKEVNAAKANFNAAIANNSNVDATKEDFLKVLEKLNEN